LVRHPQASAVVPAAALQQASAPQPFLPRGQVQVLALVQVLVTVLTVQGLVLAQGQAKARPSLLVLGTRQGRLQV